MLENLAGVVARHELRDGVVHRRVLLVLQLQRHHGQAVEVENKIDFLVRLAEVKVRPEGDAVLVVELCRHALVGTGLGVIKPEFHRADLQSVPDEHPKRRVFQRPVQGAEDLAPRVRAEIIRQLLQRLQLRFLEERPEPIARDEILVPGDLGLREHVVAMLADQKIRDVFLEGQFWRVPGHGFICVCWASPWRPAPPTA